MIRFPFTSLQQLNLDWIMEQLHKILQFMPLNGVAGDVLQRTVDGAAWQPIAAVSMDIHSLNASLPDGADEIPIYDNDLAGNYKVTVQDVLDLVPPAPVDSVNGKTGTVVLTAADVGALPDSTVIPDSTSDLINDSGFVDAAGAAAAAPVQSVNGQTGAVTLSIPTDTSDLNNDSGFVDAVGAAAAAPVQSVNGQTGNVVVSGSTPITLLWTNSDILTAFTSQTLVLDLTDYSFIIIEFAIEDVEVKSMICSVPTITPPAGYSSHEQISGIAISGSAGRLVSRTFEVTTSGIVFDSGVSFDSYNSGNSVDNALCIPSRIWGIE